MRGGRPVGLVDAAAGTGKATLLGELASVYRGQGYDVVGLAPKIALAQHPSQPDPIIVVLTELVKDPVRGHRKPAPLLLNRELRAVAGARDAGRA